MSQTELAAAMGLEHRQTIGQIESGERRITPEELVRAAEALDVELDALLDPYRLVGEARFSFRTTNVATEVLAAFEEEAGRWLATYRELSARLGEEASYLGVRLELSESSSFEEAAASGETLWRAWELGDIPAVRLEQAIERELGALVLYVDAPGGVSGAASHLPRCHAILVNRNESTSRRYYDLAHELFHLLTWEAMPPKRVEPQEAPRTKGNRVEHLADNFAAGLLMPSELLARRWGSRGDGRLVRWVSQTASDLRVSFASLVWRLVNLTYLEKTEAEPLLHAARTGMSGASGETPRLFSRRFTAVIGDAVNAGLLSLRRAAGLLSLSVVDFGRLCADYDIQLAYEFPE